MEPIPESLIRRGQELRAMDDSKKIRDDLLKLKNRLLTCREQRAQDQTNYKDLRSLQHFELLKRQQDEEIDSLQRNLETIQRQFEQKKESLLRKQLYVEDKLEKARQRVEAQKIVKSKDELNLEKTIRDLVLKYDDTIAILPNPQLAWGKQEVELIKKEFLETHPLPPPPELESLPFTASSEPKHAKRKIKTVEDKPLPVIEPLPEPVKPIVVEEQEEEKPLPVPTPSETPLDPNKINWKTVSNQHILNMDPSELFTLLRPKDKSPYGNVIGDTKLKRGVKQATR